MGGGPPERFPAHGREARWPPGEKHGREGEPRRLALQYFALGDDPEGATRASIGHYYASAGDYAEQVVAATAKGEDEVRERVRQFEEAGADELILFPASPDPRAGGPARLAPFSERSVHPPRHDGVGCPPRSS